MFFGSYEAYLESITPEPTADEINRERYAAEIASMAHEGEAEDEWRLEMEAADMGVTVEAILDAAEEYRRQCTYRWALNTHRAYEEDFLDPCPF